jgi:hypothetical protein
MKQIRLYIALLILFSISGCGKADFSDMVHDVPHGADFLFSEDISITVGKDTLSTINGKDSCFVQIIDGEDIVNVTTQYVVDDKVFFGGTTSYLMIHPIAAGEAHCRLYNDKWGFDTTVTITIKENVVHGDTDYSVYTFYPENRNFPITQEDVTIGVKGPKAMGTKIMDKFILSSTANGNNNINGNYDSWINIHLNYVGTAYVKFYNEDFDTLIQVSVLPIYTTFEEPPLDFDDTHDSVVAKMGTPSVDLITEGVIEYLCHGPIYDYTVRVNLLSSGTIKDYEVVFSDDEAKTELRSFIEERYKKMGTWDGYYIYARAYDTTYPSLYDSETKVLVENFLHGKVVYKNPENHLNW